MEISFFAQGTNWGRSVFFFSIRAVRIELGRVQDV